MALLLLLVFAAQGSQAAEPSTLPSTLPAFQLVGRIGAPAISESSGIIESRKHPGIFWTHNDSGNRPQIFAIRRDGTLVATFDIAAKNVDWEDIADDDAGHLYLSDTGNNFAKRTEVQVYRIGEPDPNAPPTAPLRVEQTWRLNYPGGEKPFDAECLFIWKQHGYIVAKRRDGQDAGLYRFDLNHDSNREPVAMQRVASIPLKLPAAVTGGDISRDGKWLALMTIIGPYVYRIDGDPARAATVQPWHQLFFDLHIEAVCFTTGGLLATTEERRVIFFPFDVGKD